MGNLTVLPDGFAGVGIYFAFTKSSDQLCYISLTDFEDENFNIYANSTGTLNGNIIVDAKTGMSTFGSGTTLYGEKMDKLIVFGNYLWVQHAYSISYKNASSGIWSFLIHKNRNGEELINSNTGFYERDISYSISSPMYWDRRLSFARNKYKFQGHHATSGHVMLIACYNSVQQIKFEGNGWVINNIDEDVANLHYDANSQDTTAIVGLDYAEDVIDGEASAAWYVIVGIPTHASTSIYQQFSQFSDYWAAPKIFRYAENVKEDTRKMQNLGTNTFQDLGSLPQWPTGAYIMQAYPKNADGTRVQFGTPAVVAVRAGFLYILATKGFKNSNAQQETDKIIGYKYKIDDASVSSITITELIGSRHLNTFSYKHDGNGTFPISGVTPVKVADHLLLPIAIQTNTYAAVNNVLRSNNTGNIYLVTSCS